MLPPLHNVLDQLIEKLALNEITECSDGVFFRGSSHGPKV